MCKKKKKISRQINAGLQYWFIPAFQYVVIAVMHTSLSHPSVTVRAFVLNNTAMLADPCIPFYFSRPEQLGTAGQLPLYACYKYIYLLTTFLHSNTKQVSVHTMKG